ncbi:Endonuclease/exonuclease/phosphatase [Phycomyces nitens]|nr:Endonuclease/exonuclease/phosphatase [Phycomyces nitens]
MPPSTHSLHLSLKSETTPPERTKTFSAVNNLLSSAANKRSKTMAFSPKPKFCHPDRLKVFVGTWNMYGRLLPIELDTFLTRNQEGTHESTLPHLDSSATHPYHLLAIGTQECERDISESLFYSSKEVWEQKLSAFLGKHYTLLETETLAALHLAVFVWNPVKHYVTNIETEHIKTGWANMVGNKGAVAVSFMFGPRSLLFINCHLTAHASHNEERNANVSRILHDLKMCDPKLPKTKKKDIKPEKIPKQQTNIEAQDTQVPESSKPADKPSGPLSKKRTIKSSIKDHHHHPHNHENIVKRFDHTFIFGDTNYRVDAERSWVLETLQKGDYKAVLKYDQLTNTRNQADNPLAGFQEHPINFPPTFKFDTKHAQESLDSSDESQHSPVSPENQPAPAKKPQEVVVEEERRVAAAPGLPLSLCYDSSPKQRVPSWTDRILWHDGKNIYKRTKRNGSIVERGPPNWWQLFGQNKLKNTQCWSYGTVMDEELAGVSDHLPVIGVFGIHFDAWVDEKKPQKRIRKKSTVSQHDQNPSKAKGKAQKRWWKRVLGFK